MAKKVIRSDIRVNKYISDSGFCSRREADKMIADERVTINGELATLGSRGAEGDKVKRTRTKLVPGKSSSGNVKKKIK